MVQWLRLYTPNADGPGSTPGQGTQSHRPQLKTPCAATETQHNLNKQTNIFKTILTRFGKSVSMDKRGNNGFKLLRETLPSSAWAKDRSRKFTCGNGIPHATTKRQHAS